MCRGTRTVLLSAAVAFALAMPAPPADAQFTAHDSLTYAYVGGRPLHLALLVPDVASPTNPVPCVVWIHGGGWAQGSYLPVPDFTRTLVENRRIALASVEYRLTTQTGLFGTEQVTFPAQIHDVKGAVRWLRANAVHFGLDPDRFGAWGNSSGGHLAALLGTSAGVPALEGTVGGNLEESSRIRVFADYYGPTDILNLASLVTIPPGCLIDYNAPSAPAAHLIGWDEPWQGIGDILLHLYTPWGPYPRLVELTESANPITWVDADDPPCVIEHGEEDTTVPIGASRLLNEAMDRMGIPHQYFAVPGVGHADPGREVEQATVDFLASILLGESPATGRDGTSTGTVTGVPGPAEPAGATMTGDLTVRPNPCAGMCRFAVDRSAIGTAVEIADVTGRCIQRMAIGTGGTAQWDGRDAAGQPVLPGLYFARLDGSRRESRPIRFVILR